MIKKISIILLVAILALWFVGSYNETTLTDRAIVLGIGIDKIDTLYKISAEVIVPTSPGAGTPASGKVIECYGTTVGKAIEDLFGRTGRVPSLGQCSVLLIGESVYKNENLSEVLAYFYLSDAFADNTLICISAGDAGEIFNKQTTLDNYVSIALESISHSRNEQMGLVSNVMQGFVSSLFDKSAGSYLSMVEFVSDNDAAAKNDENSKKASGYFETNKIAVFNSGKYVSKLSDSAYKGLALIKDSQTYVSFVVKNDYEGFDKYESIDTLSSLATLGMVSKSVSIDYSLKDNEVYAQINLKIELKKVKTDSNGTVLELVHKKKPEVSDRMRQEVIKEIETCITNLYKESKQLNSDFLLITNDLYKKHYKDYNEFIESGNSVIDNINLVFNIEVIS